MKDLDWDDLRFFLAVAAAGSLSAAARELNVNTTTVLRRIGNLEEALEARLFERLRSGYTLTQDGTRLLQSLGPVDSSLSFAATRLSGRWRRVSRPSEALGQRNYCRWLN